MVPVTLIAICITSARTQKPPEELSAVAGTSCALRSWHRDLARLPFAVPVAVPATFASQAMCSIGCLQTRGHLETRDQDAKRMRKQREEQEGGIIAALAFICSSGEDIGTVYIGLKGHLMYRT